MFPLYVFRLLLNAWIDSKSKWLVGVSRMRQFAPLSCIRAIIQRIFFTSGKYAHFLQYFLTGEQHTPEKTLHIHFVSFAKLAQPVHQVQVRIEEVGIVQRQVSGGDSHPPVEGSRIRFYISVDDFKSAVMARGLRDRNTILSPFSTLKLTSLKSTTPSSVFLLNPATSRI